MCIGASRGDYVGDTEMKSALGAFLFLCFLIGAQTLEEGIDPISEKVEPEKPSGYGGAMVRVEQRR